MLYHFFISVEVGSWSHDVSQIVKFKLVSDDILVVLSNGISTPGPKPFLFFNIWCQYGEFQSLHFEALQELGNQSTSIWHKFNKLKFRVRNLQA